MSNPTTAVPAPIWHQDSSNDDGVSQSDSQIWYQGNLGMIGTPEADDRLGSSLP